MLEGSTFIYLHNDHLGSPALTTSGTISSTLKFYAYGKPRSSSGTQPTRYQFTGQYQDDSGLTYMNARYYDSDIGTFISADTIVPSPGAVVSYNRFAYANLNPMKFKDSTGHFTDDAIQTYLKQTHGDLWEEYWKMWNENSSWMDLLHHAAAGDVFASIDMGNGGALALYQFAGVGVTSLDGVSEVWLNESNEFVGKSAGPMLDVLRPSGSKTLASGLLRQTSDRSLQAIYSSPFVHAPGMIGDKYFGGQGFVLGLHTVGQMESLGWRAGRGLTISAIGAGLSAPIVSPIWGFFAGFAAEFGLEAATESPGYSAGDQRITLYDLSVDYKGHEYLRQVEVLMWHNPATKTMSD